MTWAVLLPPAPATTGTFVRRASSIVISTTRRCSAALSVGLSPVVPQGTRKLIPAPIWRCTSRRSAFSSSERSRRNGVTSAVPHPVNIRSSLPTTLLQLVHNLPKIEEAFLAGHPSRRAQRTAGKSFAAARGVADRNRIGDGVEANLVRSGIRAGTAAAGVNRSGVTLFFHPLDQCQQRSRRCILFRRMVNLPAPCAIFRLVGKEPRCLCHNLGEYACSDRKIRAPDQARSAALDGCLRALDLAKPSRGPDYGIHTQPRQSLDIFDGCRGSREFHRRIHVAEVLCRQALELGVVVHVEAQLYIEAELRCELFDQSPHFSVSHNREVHCRVPVFFASSFRTTSAYISTASVSSRFEMRSCDVCAT